MSKAFKILLYYKYVSIADPEKLKVEQRELCTRLNLKGRILISSEGLNGTVAGTPTEIDEYVAVTSAYPEFQDLEWKISWADEQVFPKLRIVVREEIVTLGFRKTGKDIPIEEKANYIEPEELLAMYESDEDFVILDARNLYEAEVGKFKDAIIPPIDNFREFPEFVTSIENYKNKNVVTYCTGGVRCEKASAYLRQQGFKHVRQLHGGIHEYCEKADGKYFEGEMFVFDKRLHIPVNTINPKVISRCVYCDSAVTRYIDCAEHSCAELFICCAECEEKYLSMCKHHNGRASTTYTASKPQSTSQR